MMCKGAHTWLEPHMMTLRDLCTVLTIAWLLDFTLGLCLMTADLKT